jgi:hypothetical protein
VKRRPRFAKRTFLVWPLIRGGLGKPIQNVLIPLARANPSTRFFEFLNHGFLLTQTHATDDLPFAPTRKNFAKKIIDAFPVGTRSTAFPD